MNKVNGGFFWIQSDGAIELNETTPITISNCVFMARPRWWQIRSWFRAIKYVLALPHSTPIFTKYEPLSYQDRPTRWEKTTEGVRWYYTDE